jgi:hypothetical protein
VDPFRNELDAAHAKIAQLEAENRQLKGAHYPPPVSDSAFLVAKQLRRNAMVWTAFWIVAVTCGCALFAAVYFAERATPPPSPSIAPGPRARSTSP